MEIPVQYEEVKISLMDNSGQVLELKSVEVG